MTNVSLNNIQTNKFHVYFIFIRLKATNEGFVNVGNANAEMNGKVIVVTVLVMSVNV